MYNTIFQYMEGNIEDFEINYYSSEMTIEEILGEAQAFYIFVKHGILTDIDQIYSMGDNTIPTKIDELLDSEEMDKFLDLFESKIRIVNERCTSGFLYKELMTIARNNGEIVTVERNGQQVFKEYNKNNPNKWVIIIFDNFQKLKSHKGQDIRQAIVEASGYFDMARLHFGFTIAAMQQVNRGSKTFDRYKLEQFFPSEQDLKDSEAPFHDCQVCFVQISPFKLKLDEFDGYNINKGEMALRDRIRPIKVIKNRGGKAYYVDYFLFLGENSLYKEIPFSDKLTKNFYTNIYNIKKL